jgi:hypothetical protein
MSKAVDEILDSIMREFAEGKQPPKEFEAKTLFRLLNYSPPAETNVPAPEKPASVSK